MATYKIIDDIMTLSSQDWKERKTSADRITERLQNVFTDMDSMLLKLSDYLLSGNDDTRYWISEIFAKVENRYFIIYLLDLLLQHYDDERTVFFLIKILKNNADKHHELFVEYYNKANEVAKHHILCILDSYFNRDLIPFFRKVMDEKYFKLKVKALEIYETQATPAEIESLQFLINDDNLEVVRKYLEILTRLERVEKINLDNLYSQIVDQMTEDENKRLIKNLVNYRTTGNYIDFLDKLENESNFCQFTAFRLFMNTLDDITDDLFERICKYDKLLFWYVFSLRNLDWGSGDKTLIRLLEKGVSPMLTEIIMDTLRMGDSEIPSDLLSTIFHKSTNFKLKEKILSYAAKNEDDVLLEESFHFITDQNYTMRFEVAKYLAVFRRDTFIPHFIKLLDDPYWPIRKYSAGILIDYGEEVMDYIKEYLEHDNKNIRYWAVYVFINLLEDENLNRVKKIYKNNDDIDIKKLTIRNVSRLDSVNSVDFLEEVLSEKNDELLLEVLKSAIFMEEQKERMAKNFRVRLKSKNPEIQFRLLMFFDKFFPQEMKDIISKMPIEDETPQIHRIISKHR